MKFDALSFDLAIVLLGPMPFESPRPAPGYKKRILGLTILERLILSAYEAGLRDFLLVKPDEFGDGDLVPQLEEDRRFRKQDLRLAETSVSELAHLVGLSERDRRLWLFDGNVVFDPAVLAGAHEEDSVSVFSIGPGIHVCRRENFLSLFERLPTRGVEGWTAALTIPPTENSSRQGSGFCLRVVSRQDAKKAERYIMSTGRKAQDGFMARHVIRPISLRVTKQMLKLNLTPNVMTAVSQALSWVSVWLISRGDHPSAILAGCAFQAATVLDHCDGENARMTFRTSKFGSVFDLIGDALVYVAFFLALPIGLYRVSGQEIWLLLGLVVFASQVLYYLTLIDVARGRTDTLSAASFFSVTREIGQTDQGPGVKRKLSGSVSPFVSIFRREFFASAILVILIFDGAKVLMVLTVMLYLVQGVLVRIQASKRIP